MNTRSARLWYTAGPLGLLLALVSPPPIRAASDPSAADAPSGAHWVATWGTSAQQMAPKDLPPSPGLADNTLRQIVHVSIGGGRLRLRLSNQFGARPVPIDEVQIAAAAGGSTIRPATARTLLFHGAPAVTLPPGGLCLSDPVDFPLAPGSDLAVTMRFGAAPHEVTGHPGARCTTYLQAGNALAAASLPDAVGIKHWYVLTGVDVWAPDSAAAVAALGDSITDGRGTIDDENGRWTDDLARRLLANPPTAQVAVLNEGIGGNRLLHDHIGQAALKRLDRDVLAQSGVRWLIVFEGVNDIGTGPRDNAATIPPAVIGAYQQIIRRAHEHHLRVYGATITPFGRSFYDTPAREQEREAINQWIRTPGHFDAVIDFDAAARDPADPTRLAPALDCGDHLHLSEAGYVTMAGAIDLTLFSR